ncbi:MAG TPA: tetratricopeptide repeat protein [Candidatus Krumholzibacteria bacterium]|nr:tetratricopeptide repeat protein [Candidatus Krumholzibacteria bacterium]
MIRSLALVLCAVFAFSSAHAQLLEEYRFKGSVVDAAGKPIPSVRITLRDVATGSRIEFTSKEDGTFDRRMIPHARYEAFFEKPGYSTHTQEFDWSNAPRELETVEAKVVLRSEADAAKKAMGEKAAKLYEQSYQALEQNDCATASSKASEILKLGAGEYEYAVRFILARCHALQNRLPEATGEYRRVLALKPEFFEAQFDLASVLEKQGQHEDALREYEKAAALKPQDAEARYNVGAMLLKQNRYDQALPHLEAAASIDSTHALASKALGFAYLQSEKKDLTAARRYFERYLALEPNAPDAAEIRGLVAELKSTNK